MNEILQLLWQNNTGSGRSVILLIAIVGAWGAHCALSHRARYRGTERRWLETVRDRLQRAHNARQEVTTGDANAEAAGESAPPASSPLIELQELAEGIPPTSLVGDRLLTIMKMKQARARINVEALQQSTVLKESASWTLSFPAYVVSLVMMLGLLGTFIGLSFMVVDIQQSMPGQGTTATTTQWAASVTSLGRILAGKKTAFSATLAGLFVSIAVSALNYGLARAQADLYDRLERFTAEELLPATIPAFDDATPWEKLSAQLGDSFEHLKELATEQGKSAEQMAAVEKTFALVIDNIETMTQRAATAPMHGMSGDITNVIAQMTQVNSALIGVADKLPQILAAFRQTHQNTLQEIHTAMQGHQSGIDKLARALQAAQNGSRYGNVSLVAAGAAAMLLAVFVIARL